MEFQFEKNHFSKRLISMLKVDFRRIFTTPLFYLMIGISLVVPILILVMTTMMDGTVSVNPQTQVETVIEGFDNVWQAIGILGGASGAMDMSLTGMCNINLTYFMIAAPVCIFISEDFRSGYAKNLFTVRSKKLDYVISKTLLGFVVATSMLVAFFIGTLFGGGVAGLPFAFDGFNAGNLIACVLSKIAVSLIFVSIFVLASIIAKNKLWLSILLSLCIGMLFFAIVPMVTPLNATLLHVVLCFAGGGMFSVGLGAISNQILKTTSLI